MLPYFSPKCLNNLCPFPDHFDYWWDQYLHSALFLYSSFALILKWSFTCNLKGIIIFSRALNILCHCPLASVVGAVNFWTI